MNIVKRILRFGIRGLIAIVAVVNLVLLFVFNYNLPDSLQAKVDRIVYGGRRHATEFLPSGEEAPVVEELVNASLIVPSQAINYMGGNLDLTAGIYALYDNGIRVDDLDIEAEIEEGNTRLDKVVNYSTVLSDGQQLTGTRTIRIGSRYTGPTLTVTGDIPSATPDDNLKAIVQEAIANGNVYAEDGFGNDITTQVQGRLDRRRNEDGESVYTFILFARNAVGDAAEVVIGDELNTSGVVMKLTTYDLTLSAGTPFWYLDYVADCHDSHGNDLHRSIHVNGSVNSYVVGDYELQYYCVDANGVSSPVRTLKVHII